MRGENKKHIFYNGKNAYIKSSREQDFKVFNILKLCERKRSTSSSTSKRAKNCPICKISNASCIKVKFKWGSIL